jgi:hypothetical protein
MPPPRAAFALAALCCLAGCSSSVLWKAPPDGIVPNAATAAKIAKAAWDVYGDGTSVVRDVSLRGDVWQVSGSTSDICERFFAEKPATLLTERPPPKSSDDQELEEVCIVADGVAHAEIRRRDGAIVSLMFWPRLYD